jgi:ribosomal protein L32
MEIKLVINNGFAYGDPAPETFGLPSNAQFVNGSDYDIVRIQVKDGKILVGRDYCSWVHFVDADGCNHIIYRCPNCGAWDVHRTCPQCGKSPQDDTELKEYEIASEFPIDIEV